MSFVTRRNGSGGGGETGSHLVQQHVAIGSGAPSVVRELVREVAQGTPVCDDALLLSSEITTNAVIHGRWSPGDVLMIAIERRPERLEIAVTGPGLPKPIRENRRESLGGFGLDLVASISSDWAMEGVDDEMTRVWFELRW
jgi:anti-sigma regulatory factor (Ser/Thr protein kinase)